MPRLATRPGPSRATAQSVPVHRRGQQACRLWFCLRRRRRVSRIPTPAGTRVSWTPTPAVIRSPAAAVCGSLMRPPRPSALSGLHELATRLDRRRIHPHHAPLVQCGHQRGRVGNLLCPSLASKALTSPCSRIASEHCHGGDLVGRRCPVQSENGPMPSSSLTSYMPSAARRPLWDVRSLQPLIATMPLTELDEALLGSLPRPPVQFLGISGALDAQINCPPRHLASSKAMCRARTQTHTQHNTMRTPRRGASVYTGCTSVVPHTAHCQ